MFSKFLFGYLLLSITYISTCFSAESSNTIFFPAIDENVPNAMMLGAFRDYNINDLSKMDTLKNVSIEVFTREVNYTQDTWLKRFFSGLFLSNTNMSSHVLNESTFFLQNMGSHHDDAVVLQYKDLRLLTSTQETCNVAVFDGRFLLLSISIKNIDERKPLDILRTVSGTSLSNHWKYEVSQSPNVKDVCSWGTINVVPASTNNAPTTWFYFPIEWYMNNDFCLFAIKKYSSRKKVIGGYAQTEQMVCGGIDIEDGRSWLRFMNSNREELSKEYWEKYKDLLQPRYVNDDHQLKGLDITE